MQVRSKKWNTRFDEGINNRGKIGFVLIPNEQTIEEEMMRLRPKGVGVYFSRVMMPREISTEALAKCGEGIADAVSRILPDDKIDVSCFACTSGTVAVGEERTLAELRKGAPDAKPTSLMTSVVGALKVVGAQNIAMGCPYRDELASNVATFLEGKGFHILDCQGLNLDFDTDMIRVSPDFLIEFALSIDVPEADTLLLSCGAPRYLEVLDEIEKKINKPVIASNQAMMWNCLRMLGVNDKIEGYGRLFREF